MPESHPKVVVVGAGAVGSTLAYACLLQGTARSYVLYDIHAEKAEAEALDLAHGRQFVAPASVVGGNDLGLCADADVIVITAGVTHKLGETRLDIASTNAGVARELVPQLLAVAPDAIILAVTNPVDIVTTVALEVSGLPRHRVIGSGTVLDSSRFRYLLADACDVAVSNVHAYIVGEHGDSEVPLWSSAAVGGVPVLEWERPGLGVLTQPEQDEIVRDVREAGYQLMRGKGATNFAIGLAGARILDAILHDERAVLPVSTLMTGQHGIDGVCLSMPCSVHRGGADAPIPIPLAADEREALERSAGVIADVLAGVRER